MSVLVEIILVVLLTYMIIFFVIIVRYALANDLPDKEIILDPCNLKTGDILVVGYKNVFGLFITSWSGSLWSHTGIVFKDESGIYVLEAANYGKNYNGAFKIPFDVWLKINGNSHIAILKYCGKGFPKEQLIEEFNKYSEVKLDTYSHRWVRFLIKRLYKGPKVESSYTCYEMTVSILQHIGVMKKKYTFSSYFPREFVNLNLDLVSGHKYESYLLIHK